MPQGPGYDPALNPPPPPGPATYGSAPQLGGATGGYTGNAYGGSPSIVGTGMYNPGNIAVNQNAFNNPVGAQAGQELSGLLPNYLQNTTGGVIPQQAAGGNQAGYNAGMQGQLGVAGQYGAMAAGQGPSLATVTANQQGAKNLQATESMLGSARGAGNPAAAQAAAAGAAETGQQQIAQNAVAGRTQEELGAMGAEAGLYGNIGAQGLQQQQLGQSNNQFNAGQANQLGQSNQANNSQQYQNYMAQLANINAQQQQGQIQGQQTAAQTQLGQEQIASNAYNNAANNNSKLAGSVLSGASGLAGMFL